MTSLFVRQNLLYLHGSYILVIQSHPCSGNNLPLITTTTVLPKGCSKTQGVVSAIQLKWLKPKCIKFKVFIITDMKKWTILSIIYSAIDMTKARLRKNRVIILPISTKLLFTSHSKIICLVLVYIYRYKQPQLLLSRAVVNSSQIQVCSYINISFYLYIFNKMSNL